MGNLESKRGRRLRWGARGEEWEEDRGSAIVFLYDRGRVSAHFG